MSQRIYAKTTSSEGTSAEVGQHAFWHVPLGSLPSFATRLNVNSHFSRECVPLTSCFMIHL